MARVEVNGVAYAKVMAHAAQHPHAAVDGLLLASASSSTSSTTSSTSSTSSASSSTTVVADAVPLRHSKTTLSLGLDAALRLVEAHCRASAGSARIVGVYVADANASASGPSPVALQLANAVRERTGATLLLVVDNGQVFSQTKAAFVLHRWSAASGGWEKVADSDTALVQGDATRTAVQRALAAGKQTALVDLDDSFDNPALDWRNGAVGAWLGAAS